MTDVTKTTIPHKACGTPGECRKEQVCLDGWRCALRSAAALLWSLIARLRGEGCGD